MTRDSRSKKALLSMIAVVGWSQDGYGDVLDEGCSEKHDIQRSRSDSSHR